MTMRVIDGSRYSGRGTIAKQAVVFAALIGQAVHIVKTRVQRPELRLLPQPIGVLEAIHQVAGGPTEGVEVGAQDLTFWRRLVRQHCLSWRVDDHVALV